MDKKKKQSIKANNNEPLTLKEFFETKNEFIQRFDKVELALQNQAKAILENRDQIKGIKNTMSTKNDIRELITKIDEYIIDTRNYGAKAITNTNRINDLEERVTVLEAQQK